MAVPNSNINSLGLASGSEKSNYSKHIVSLIGVKTIQKAVTVDIGPHMHLIFKQIWQ